MTTFQKKTAVVIATIIVLGLGFLIFSSKPETKPQTNTSSVKTASKKTVTEPKSKPQSSQPTIQYKSPEVLPQTDKNVTPPTTKPKSQTTSKPKPKPEPKPDPEPPPPFSAQVYTGGTYYKPGNAVTFWINANRDVERCVGRAMKDTGTVIPISECGGSFVVAQPGIYVLDLTVHATDGSRTSTSTSFAVF